MTGDENPCGCESPWMANRGVDGGREEEGRHGLRQVNGHTGRAGSLGLLEQPSMAAEQCCCGGRSQCGRTTRKGFLEEVD